MHVIGTAGHVDHGKSALVTALTGHNPDRLAEEQLRGMTLDLGFAPLRFADGIEAGIIDVPGHERFLHNMLAGAAGMELLLLVIAAPDGPKRQTFEHLQILSFLNATKAIIVLTKIDLVDFDDRTIAAKLAREACEGTVAAQAPVIPVSTVTGEGLDSLKEVIHDALAALPSRRVQAPAFLPVDRVFALPGHGTIVTGTLMQGSISVGETLELQPCGVSARVRNLQIFGQRVTSATGGSRVAVNLPSVDVAQVERGEALVAQRQFEPTRELAVDFTPLPAAIPLLRRRMQVRVHIGSAEIPAQLRFVNGVPTDATKVRAHVSLWKSAVFFPGMRAIIRRLSPKDLLGGAVLSSGIRLETSSEFDDGPQGTNEVFETVRVAGLAPLSATKIAAQANVVLALAEDALAWLAEHGHVVQLHKPVEYIARTPFEDAFKHIAAVMRDRHCQAPWRLGITADEAASTISSSVALTNRLLHAWQEDGRVSSRVGVWHAVDFSPTLTKQQRSFFEKAMAINSQTPYLPHSHATIVSAAAERSQDMVEALDSLLAVGAFIKIGDDLYRRSQLDRAREAISAIVGENGHATMAQLRDVLGTSRKYALPLMEYFDSIGFTIRDGDLRRLRKVK